VLKNRWRRLLLDGIAEFLDHRIGEYLAGDSGNLGLGPGSVQAAIERELEELALADVVHTLVAHLAERALDGLALGIEHGLLQRDVNVSLHR